MSSDSTSLLPFLNHDIITYIFHHNTQILESKYGSISKSSALHTTRYTSQVCRSWRHIILNSPTIWGNMIDLEILGKESEQWFEEVVKRTGKARLSIYGQALTQVAIERLISLLEENWARVRRINIVVLVFEVNPNADFGRFYDIFWKRDAPSLEDFVVHVFRGRSSDEDKWGNFKLFNGSAPLLRRMQSPDFHFDQHASWTTQLVAITLPSSLKVNDALHVLVKTPLLETLLIHSTGYYDDSADSWKKKIQLPNLRLIVVGSDIASLVAYLSHITPNPDCALRLTVRDDLIELQNTNNDNLRQLLKIVFPYVEGYFRGHYPTKLTISIGGLGVGFDVYELWDPDGDFESDFEISIGPKTVSQTSNPSLINTLFASLAPATLNKVSIFELTVYHSFGLPTADVVIRTLRSLMSVKNMKLTPWALRSLNDLPYSATLFPELAEVTIDYQTGVLDLDQILHVFLTRRQEVGNPLQTLYKPDNSRPKGAKHWAFLNQFDGLRVISTGEGDDSDDSYVGEDDSEDEDDEEGFIGEGDDGDDNEYGDDDDEDAEDEDV